MGEKGAYGKEGYAWPREARTKGVHGNREGRAHTGREAQTAKGSAHSQGGTNNNGGRVWKKEARTAKGTPTVKGAHVAMEGAHGQGARRCTPLMMTVASCHMVGMGRICTRPSLGARTAPRRRVYMSCPPHLKLPSLLLLAPCLAPAKCFA
jgi:hypothetical protein